MDPTQRFSGRVEKYTRYRPGYPPAILESLRADCGLTPEAVIADIGSGTGMLSVLFLNNGNRVMGVEPNPEMRAEGERVLAGYPGFTSIAGTAEGTTLAESSVDFVTAAQAFHWFQREQARWEFGRILKPGGWVALVWNERLTDVTPFLREYESLLLKYGTDYREVDHRRIDDAVLREFFGEMHQKTFDNRQVFDFDGVRGRLLSSSYAPQAGHPNHAPMLRELRAIFDEYQIEGSVVFEYKTILYYARLQKAGG